jgi:hypothetical protein
MILIVKTSMPNPNSKEIVFVCFDVMYSVDIDSLNLDERFTDNFGYFFQMKEFKGKEKLPNRNCITFLL